MVNIRSTPQAQADAKMIGRMNPQGWVEVLTTLSNLASAGLAGEAQVAVLNTTLEVYVFEPDPPGPLIIALHDPAQPADLIVTNFHLGMTLPLNSYQVQSVVSDAAASAVIAVSDVHVVP